MKIKSMSKRILSTVALGVFTLPFSTLGLMDMTKDF